MGHDAVGVVLSGGGTDGATGSTAMHDLGGIVIAAAQASSEQFSMKATIARDDATVHILNVD